MFTLSPAGTSKCAVSKCDSPRQIGEPSSPNYAIDQHSEINYDQLIEMGQAGWLCTFWVDRHLIGPWNGQGG